MDISRSAISKLALLAVGMVVIAVLASPVVPRGGERQAWETVRAAQEHVADWRREQGTAASREDDPFDCGLIGVEWSPLTTTLGSIEAKQASCNPAWAVRFMRWYRDMGLNEGDTVAIFSSASFPAMLLNALVAAETLGLEVELLVSLGASTWGANHPGAPWPAISAELRRGGYLRNKADFYTLGGSAENGGGMAEEGVSLLEQAAGETGVSMLRAAGVEEMIESKSAIVEQSGARLLVSIGGSQANLGTDPDVLRLEPGVHRPGDDVPAGNGVIASALETGVPVLHVLNVRELAAREGIAFDGAPQRLAPVDVNPWWAAFGLAVFFGVLLTHRRWRLL